MTSTTLILLFILLSGMWRTTNNSIIRNSRQIFYPNRPMIYTEKSVSLSPQTTFDQFKDPDVFTSIKPPSLKKKQPKLRKPDTHQVILVGMPVGVPLSFLPPPAGLIATSSSITNDAMQHFGVRGQSSSSQVLFGARNKPMMQSASFGHGPRIRPHGLPIEKEVVKEVGHRGSAALNSMSDLFPKYSSVPETSFRCSEHQFPGYYGDVETRCQVIHVCQSDGRHDSFLCPNGTIFNQQYFVCDWWFNVDCDRTPMLYSLNSQLYKH